VKVCEDLINKYLCALNSRPFNCDKRNIIGTHSISVFLFSAIKYIRRNVETGMAIFLSGGYFSKSELLQDKGRA